MAKWTASDIPDQSGRTVVITGANSGLGLRSAEALAARGARVVMACRDAARAAVAVATVAEVATGPAPEVLDLDLADLDSIRRAADELAGRVERVDVLVNNAGIMAVPEGRTVDGFERQFATNHLGHFALTGRVLPVLLAAPAPRVVTVSSNAHKFGRMHFEDLHFDLHRYSRWGAYGQSKLANLLFSGELSRRAAAARQNVLSVAAHPGYAATNLTSGPATGAELLAPVLRLGDRLIGQSDHMGALPQLYAATMPTVGPDDYWGPDALFGQRGHPAPVGRSARARDRDDAAQLWEVSEQLTGVAYAWP